MLDVTCPGYPVFVVWCWLQAADISPVITTKTLLLLLLLYNVYIPLNFRLRSVVLNKWKLHVKEALVSGTYPVQFSARALAILTQIFHSSTETFVSTRQEITSITLCPLISNPQFISKTRDNIKISTQNSLSAGGNFDGLNCTREKKINR